MILKANPNSVSPTLWWQKWQKMFFSSTEILIPDIFENMIYILFFQFWYFPEQMVWQSRYGFIRVHLLHPWQWVHQKVHQMSWFKNHVSDQYWNQIDMIIGTVSSFCSVIPSLVNDNNSILLITRALDLNLTSQD